MADPKNPKPHHPLALAAAEEEQQIQQMISAPQDEPPVVPDPPPAPAISAPNSTAAPAAPVAPVLDKLQAQFETMLGRVEKLNEENRSLQAKLATIDANRQFLEQRAKERQEEYERLVARNRELEAALEVDAAAKGFQSDLVDQTQFAEIFRGLAPHLKKRDEMIERVLARNAELEKKLDDVLGTVRNEVSELDRKWLDRSLLRSSPEIKNMLKSKEGEEFLAQRIPGSRRTRAQELQDAYRDGDDAFIAQLVSEFKQSLAVQANVVPDPQPSIVSQAPRAPRPETPITDDDVQAAFQKTLRGEMSRADFKKLLAAQQQQVAAGGQR